MELVLTSILAFASTNIDDLFILMLFFSNTEYKQRQVVTGQYLGIIALILISFLGSLMGLFIDPRYIGLLGLLPVYMGLKGVFQLIQNKGGDRKTEVRSFWKLNKSLAVAGVTFANGSDNIGIYIPLFATLLMPQKLIMIGIFLLMTAAWCLIAMYLVSHPTIAKLLEKYGHYAAPIILVFLGIFIMYESGTWKLFSLF